MQGEELPSFYSDLVARALRRPFSWQGGQDTLSDHVVIFTEWLNAAPSLPMHCVAPGTGTSHVHECDGLFQLEEKGGRGFLNLALLTTWRELSPKLQLRLLP